MTKLGEQKEKKIISQNWASVTFSLNLPFPLINERGKYFQSKMLCLGGWSENKKFIKKIEL